MRFTNDAGAEHYNLHAGRQVFEDKNQPYNK
jgi:hypothetical protein